MSCDDIRLLKTPYEKAEAIEKLVEKYLLNFQSDKRVPGRPRKDFNEEEINLLIAFLARIDITTLALAKKIMFTLVKKIVSGTTNNAFVSAGIYGTFCLSPTVLVKSVSNSFCQAFDKLLTFSQLYDFFSKTFKAYSFILVNYVLLAKGLNKKLRDSIPYWQILMI